MKKLLSAFVVCMPLLAHTQVLTPYPTGQATSLYVTHRNTYAVDNNDNVWVGFLQAGLGKCAAGTWTFYDTNNSGIPSNNVLSVLPVNNTVWAGTNAGAARLNGSSWTVYNTANSGLPCDTVLSICMAGSDTWFGTAKGVARFDGSSWTTYSRSNSSLLSDTVYSLCLDGSGRMLMGTAQGLNAFTLGTSAWSSFSTNQNQPFTGNVTALFFEPVNGEVWIATFNSYVYRLIGNVVYPFTAFTDDFIFAQPKDVLNFISPAPGVVKFCYNSLTGRGIMTFDGNNAAPKTYFIGGAKTFLLFNPATGHYFIGNQMGALTGNAFLAKFDPAQVHPYTDGNMPDYGNTRALDVNQVRAAIANRGDMHWNLFSGARYEVPRGSGCNTNFASGLWMGGFDGSNQLHQAATTFRQNGNDFFPGPLDTLTGITDSAAAEQFDYIWKIDKAKILEFQYYFANGSVQNGSYVPDHDILTWPAQGNGNFSRNLAPFVDVNQNNIYDPLTGGDYPDIRGDQMLYCIYNDQLAAHMETGGLPLGIEVHLSAYAYSCPQATGNDTVINYTTYYHYDVYNRSNTAYHDTRLGIFDDCDLGFFYDDFIGCSPQDNLAFAYNGTANDGGMSTPSPGAYGAHPPLQGMVILDGPLASPNDNIDNDNDGTIDEAGEKCLLGNLQYYNNDFSVTGNPSVASDYYGYLSSTWKDNTPVTYGGNGYGGNTNTNFMFSGVPFVATDWSEASANNVPGDRRYVMACGPFDFPAGAKTSFDYAFVYSRDTLLAWGTPSYTSRLLSDVQHVTNWFRTNTTPSCAAFNVGVGELSPAAAALLLFPDPAHDQLTLRYTGNATHARYALLDMTGRVIETGALDGQSETTLDITALARGMYFISVGDGGSMTTKKFARQ